MQVAAIRYTQVHHFAERVQREEESAERKRRECSGSNVFELKLGSKTFRTVDFTTRFVF
jgi:hypothetical protein